MTGTNSQSDQIQKIIWSDLFLTESVKYRIYVCLSMKYRNKKNVSIGPLRNLLAKP